MLNTLHSLNFQGDLETSLSARQRYATDASVFEELPLAIAFPKNVSDVQALVTWSQAQGISLTARGAGTSLAGQAIGTGVVMDFTPIVARLLRLILSR